MALPGDPLDWSIDEVVDALCKSTSWWMEGRPNSILPDPTSLEEKLRDQEINGFALLTYFNSEQRLKDDLGVKTIGRISAVSWAIDKLREQSSKYAEHLASQRSISARASVAHSIPGSTAQSAAGSHSYQAHPIPGWLGSLPRPSDHSRIGLATPTYESALSTVPEAGEDMIENANQHDTESAENTAGSAKRHGEIIVQDAEGRKRRKLVLAVPSAASMPPPAPRDTQIQAISRNAREKFPVDKIFYGDTAIGHILEDDDDLNFEHHGEVPSDVGSYVYRQYLHFIRNSERKELFRDGRKTIAVYPYRSKVLAENKPRSATVIELTNDGAKATRQSTLSFQSRGSYDSSILDEGEDSHAFYALAERWTKDDDKVLPALGESDEEDYSSSYEAELEAEERERALQEFRCEQLSKEKVSAIVEERMQELVGAWKKRKLPLHQRKAKAIWKKGKRRQERLALREAAAKTVEKIDHRLTKLCEAIVDEEWHKKDEVLRQCATLEESIFQREEELWRMSVWDLKVEPALLPASTASRRTMKKSVEDQGKDLGEEAGDWVNSESELESDGLGDFVEIDQDIKETSPEMSPAVTVRDSFDMGPEPDSVNMADASDGSPIDVGDTGTVEALKIASRTANSTPTTPERPQTAFRDSTPRSTHSVIDLTALSDGPEPLSPTPVPRLTLSESSDSAGSAASLSRADPQNSTFADVQRWDFPNLQERNDKKRLVLKIIRTVMSRKEYKFTQAYATSVAKEMLHSQLWQAIEAICRGEKLIGMAQEEWDNLVRFARLYACWRNVNQKHWSTPSDKLTGVLSKIMEKRDISMGSRFNSDFETFRTFVVAVFEKFTSQKSDAVLLEPSTNDEDQWAKPTDTPHKKRKNKVEQSRSAISQRKSAQKRAEVQVEKEREFQERVSSSHSTVNNLIVNPGEYGKDGAIYIHQHIGRSIKNHQIEGIRFMWREIVETAHNTPQGCLLAHTMGLGKTMQAITLLVTIAEAVKSSHKGIQLQVPVELRRVQTLILCPATLIDNWIDELYKWIPKSVSKKIGPIHRINADSDFPKRLTTIEDWDQNGGILVVSYEMFRNFFSEKQASKMSNEERLSLQRTLFEGPSIIVADEAHKMKNSASSLRGLVERFKSKSRLALTGSPLANNLVEYWSMIDWISPGYLGSLKEFRAYFVEPIEEGLYKDSTKYEHRKALKKLRVLKTEIGPKINRADITVLRDDLKPKVEFLITVPLTRLQEDLYKLCVQFFLGNHQEKVSNTRLWQWMHFLSTLCTHPAAFRKLLKDPQARHQDNKHDATEESEVNDLQDTSPDEHGLNLDPRQDFPSSFIEQATWLCDRPKDQDSAHLSFKTEILMDVLKSSKEAGDRVLVFSHHLATLDYLENLLARAKYKFVRLDGKIKMSNRPELLEKFNKGGYDLFLISTKAGGTGFNLPGANRVVILDFGFNPQNEEQAIGRAYRLGQEKEVFVYRMLTGGTYEPKVWNKALFKTQLASRVVDKKNPERHAEKMRDYFFDPTPVQQEDLSEHQGKDGKVLDSILARRDRGDDPGIRAITTTETLMTEDLDAVLNDQENEEVRKMIEAERLRKEDPKAYEQYLKDNPAIDDSRNNPGIPLQSSLLHEAAVRNGTVPKPYLEFGSSPSSNATTPTGKPTQAIPSRSAGLPSSDAGINNVGPSPASMRRQVQLQHTPRKSTEFGPERVPLLNKGKAHTSLKETQRVHSSSRHAIPKDGPLSDPGVNNSSPSLPGAKPLAISLISSSPAPRRGPLNEGPAHSSLRRGRHMSQPQSHRQSSPPGGTHASERNRFMSSTMVAQDSTSNNPVRSITSPPRREVQKFLQLKRLTDDLKTEVANDTCSADNADTAKGRNSGAEEVPDSDSQ